MKLDDLRERSPLSQSIFSCDLNALVLKKPQQWLHLTPTCGCKMRTYDKRVFLLLLWQGHGQAGLLSAFSGFDQTAGWEDEKAHKEQPPHLGGKFPLPSTKRQEGGKDSRGPKTRLTQHFNQTGINVPLPQWERSRTDIDPTRAAFVWAIVDHSQQCGYIRDSGPAEQGY